MGLIHMRSLPCYWVYSQCSGIFITGKINFRRLHFPHGLSHLYNYAWFVGFFVSGLFILLLMKFDYRVTESKIQK